MPGPVVPPPRRSRQPSPPSRRQLRLDAKSLCFRLRVRARRALRLRARPSCSLRLLAGAVFLAKERVKGVRK